MAHFQQLQFVTVVARHMSANWSGLSVVEIGSADVNGSIRELFPGTRYTGVDLAAGAGVDLVGSGHEVALPADSVDLAISCECFEHNPMWRETFVNMHRMTRPGGVVLFTCASRGRLEHGTTRTRPFDSPASISVGWDYYRNLNREDFERLPLRAMFESHAFFRNDVSKDLYFVGRKPGASRRLNLDTRALWTEMSVLNTLVRPDRDRPDHGWLRRMINRPLKWAERLPDPVFQDFVVRWTGLERTLRRVFRSSRTGAGRK